MPRDAVEQAVKFKLTEETSVGLRCRAVNLQSYPQRFQKNRLGLSELILRHEVFRGRGDVFHEPVCILEVRVELPLKRFGQPEEVAKMAYFLGSDLAGYTTGQLIPVDGGYGL